MANKKPTKEAMKLAKQGTLAEIHGDLVANEIENRWESSYTRKYQYNGMSVEFSTPYDPWSYPDRFTKEWEICVAGLVGDIFQDIAQFSKMDQVEKERWGQMMTAFDEANKCSGCRDGRKIIKGLTEVHVALHYPKKKGKAEPGLGRNKFFEYCQQMLTLPTKEKILRATESDKNRQPYLAEPYRSPFEEMKKIALKRLGIDPASIPKK